MTIASKVEDYMAQRGIKYDVVTHEHSRNSIETAHLAHVPGDRLAKSVVLEDDDGFVMAVLPSTCHIKLGRLSRQLDRKLRLASESDLPSLFGDCELGAIPAVGPAYGMLTVIDKNLGAQPDIYFEAGDHEDLIHMKQEEFTVLMHDAVDAGFATRR